MLNLLDGIEAITSTGFILIVLWYVLLYLSTISCNLSIFWYWGKVFIIFFFKVLTNLSATTDFEKH